jgi:DNA-binding NarL/FixJ family response regulator
VGRMASSAMRISVTQQKMIALAAQGKSSKEIGEELRLSTGTVKFHFSELYRDLGLYGQGSRFELLKLCNFLGLVKI